MTRLFRRFFVVSMLFSASFPWAQSDDESDRSLIIVGSDTLAKLVTAWAEQFYVLNPTIVIEVQAVGSAATPPALLLGTATIGTMSRRMNADERDAFTVRKQRPPIEISLAVDAVVLIVHQQNPLESVSMAEVGQIFGMPGTCGNSVRPVFWRDLREDSVLADRKLQVFGRTATSGTYQYFRRAALCDGDPGIFVNEMPGGAGIVNTVARVPGGIGYTATSYTSNDVKILGIERPDGRVLYPEDPEYPLKRTLYLYVMTDLSSEVPSIECEFLAYVAGEKGRDLLRSAGFSIPQVADSQSARGVADACG